MNNLEPILRLKMNAVRYGVYKILVCSKYFPVVFSTTSIAFHATAHAFHRMRSILGKS